MVQYYYQKDAEGNPTGEPIAYLDEVPADVAETSIPAEEVPGFVSPDTPFKTPILETLVDISTRTGGGDRDLLFINVPADHADPGTVFEYELFGVETQRNTAGGLLGAGSISKKLTLYVKVNNTKICEKVVTIGTGALSNAPWRMEGMVQQITTGPQGILTASMEARVHDFGDLLTGLTGGLINTGNPYTITLGLSHSDDNPDNKIRPIAGFIRQVV